jgi:hypothetical protein
MKENNNHKEITNLNHKKVIAFHQELGNVVFKAIDDYISAEIIIAKLESMKANILYHAMASIDAEIDRIHAEYHDKNLEGYG